MYLLEIYTLTTSILDKIDAKFTRKRMLKWRVLAFAWLFCSFFGANRELLSQFNLFKD